MKYRHLMAWIRTLPLLLVAGISTAWSGEPRTVVLDVPGMTCKFCPITIRKALQRVPGVIEAKSDYASKTAVVTFDPDKTNVSALTEATANAGYKSHLKQQP